MAKSNVWEVIYFSALYSCLSMRILINTKKDPD
nr:MAG TPA: hypothetical protein [Caudoviricetes sp.]